MTLVLVTPPATLPLTLNEIKSHTRLEGVNGDEEDALLMAYLASATASIDGRDGWLGRALITQTWDLKLDCFPAHSWTTPLAEIVVPLPPLQSVVSITYVDGAGAPQTLAPSAYMVAGTMGALPARIVPAYGQSWPDVREQVESVVVRFRCGFGDDASDVPEPIRHALMLMVAESHCDREGEMGLPAGVTTLLSLFRVWF